MDKILIVDDDFEIATLLSDSLIDEGFLTSIKTNGEDAYNDILVNKDYSLIILDIMMPKINGLDLCKKIRDEVSCPIIFISAKNRTLDTVLGLELGADDYIKKPFSIDEVISRIKAHIRSSKRYSMSENKVLYLDDLIIHKDRYEVFRGNQPIYLTTREFQLLVYLVENKGKVLSKEQIFDAVWGSNYMDMGTVNVNIKSLRDKLETDNKYIKTIWGVGYKLVGVNYEN